jgi:hypothetical protein
VKGPLKTKIKKNYAENKGNLLLTAGVRTYSVANQERMFLKCGRDLEARKYKFKF